MPETLDGDQIAEARERLKELARALGRISARACHGMDIDMDDPEIARAMLAMTFDAIFGPPAPNRKTKRDSYQSSTP